MTAPGQDPTGKDEIEDLQPREEESAELKAGKIVYGSGEDKHQTS
jgi:hypothetical protein